MIAFHPDAGLLLDYATGTQPEALALAVATHAAMCEECAGAIRTLEALGGALLAGEPPTAVRDDALPALLAQLDRGEERAIPATPHPLDAQTVAVLPAPLHRYLSASLERLPWRRVGRLFEEHRLPLADGRIKAALCRLRPGILLPRHSHRGQEYSVVLAGGYRDEAGVYRRGDFVALDKGDPEHQPIVDEHEPCLCLVVQDAPVRLSGPLGMLINPFLRL
jgi:putative transcriptional regulator